jgi:hypothetical protein
MENNPQSLTITLSPDEIALLNTLTEERGLSDPVAALHVLLKDAASFYDALWDQSFDKSQDILDRLADEAHQEFVRGETETLDLDADEAL